jgi:hypothetical protein
VAGVEGQQENGGRRPALTDSEWLPLKRFCRQQGKHVGILRKSDDGLAADLAMPPPSARTALLHQPRRSDK